MEEYPSAFAILPPLSQVDHLPDGRHVHSFLCEWQTQLQLKPLARGGVSVTAERYDASNIIVKVTDDEPNTSAVTYARLFCFIAERGGGGDVPNAINRWPWKEWRVWWEMFADPANPSRRGWM